MSARDKIHKPVKQALINDGWDVTDDPLILKIGRRTAKADLGAERLIGATRNHEKIAVEIKSFLNKSALTDFEKALGQYMVYARFLLKLQPERKIYLAVSEDTYSILQEIAFEMLIEYYHIRLIVIDIDGEEVIKWID